MDRPVSREEILFFCGAENAVEFFDYIVKGYLSLVGGGVEALAARCEVAPTTITRWAEGKVSPRPVIQAWVIKWISREVEKLPGPPNPFGLSVDGASDEVIAELDTIVESFKPR